VDYVDPNTLVFSATVNGYSDIYLYFLNTRQSQRITSDFYDDLRNEAFGVTRIKKLFRAMGKAYTPEEKWLFLNFMRSCGLCFPLNERKHNEEETEEDYYVYPEFLPNDMPQAVTDFWSQKQEVRHYRRQYDYLNSYRIQTFIARLGPKTNRAYLWRNGILVNNEETCFLLKADYENDSLLVQIEADKADRWAGNIIYDLERNESKAKTGWEISEDGERYEPFDWQAARQRQWEQQSLAEQLSDVPKEEPKRLVVSYAKEDREEVIALKKHLSALMRSHDIDFWYDQELDGRRSWNAVIQEEFEQADGFIIFMSPSYVDHEVKRYIFEKEIPIMQKRQREEQIPGYCITVSAVDYGEDLGQFDYFADRQAIPASQKERDSFLFRFVNEVIKTKFLKL